MVAISVMNKRVGMVCIHGTTNMVCATWAIDNP